DAIELKNDLGDKHIMGVKIKAGSAKLRVTKLDVRIHLLPWSRIKTWKHKPSRIKTWKHKPMRVCVWSVSRSCSSATASVTRPIFLSPPRQNPDSPPLSSVPCQNLQVLHLSSKEQRFKGTFLVFFIFSHVNSKFEHV
ncbi:hypothetical protein HAX54_034155, partial [Datura stramonium]|nr:hypothetical protein [Datura stramonium]